MSTISAIPEETDTLIQKKPQASLKFQAHMGAANASTNNGVPCRGENVVQSKFDDEACEKGVDPEGEVCSNDVAPGAEMWLDHFQYTCNYEVGKESGLAFAPAVAVGNLCRFRHLDRLTVFGHILDVMGLTVAALP